MKRDADCATIRSTTNERGLSVKIVVLDGFALNPGDLSWDGLRALGELTVYDRTDAENILPRIADAEIVLSNKTPLDAGVLLSCRKLRFIGVLATGYDIVDVRVAVERGITVTNIPAYGTAAVGQFAIALLLEICHHVQNHANAVCEGRWTNGPDWCFWDYPLIELAGKTIGIVGFGRIGQTTGRIAKALGMNVFAHDSHISDEGRAIGQYVTLDELLRQSDVVALHCPLTSETHQLIDRAAIEKMKDGVIILNNSRGQLIHEQDLADALNSGKVYAAGLDVVSTEPIREDNPLLKAKNCIITPHISWASKESRQRLMNIAVGNLAKYLKGTPVNVVH